MRVQFSRNVLNSAVVYVAMRNGIVQHLCWNERAGKNIRLGHQIFYYKRGGGPPKSIGL